MSETVDDQFRGITLGPVRIAYKFHPPGTVSMPAPIWRYWAEIAIENEHAAFTARLSDQPQRMTDEVKAGMIALTASAHAIDAVYGRIASKHLIPGKEKPRPNASRAGIILETFKRAYRVKIEPWIARADWLFAERRDPVVHHDGEPRPVVPHPAYPMHVPPEIVDYCAEPSAEAVSFMLEVLTHTIGSESAQRRQQIEALIAMRDRLTSERRTNDE